MNNFSSNTITFNLKSFLGKLNIQLPKMNSIASLGTEKGARKYLYDNIADDHTEVRIMDLSNGDGENLELIFKKFPNANVYAVCMSDSLVNIQSNSFYQKFQSQIELVDQSLYFSDDIDMKFDLVICSFVMSKMLRVNDKNICDHLFHYLKPRGKFLCLEAVNQTVGLRKKILNYYASSIMPTITRLLSCSEDEYSKNIKDLKFLNSHQKLVNYFENKGFKHWEFNIFGGMYTIHIFNPKEF